MTVIREFQGEYRFLSNFWLVDVEYQGVVYPSTEHAYQAAKFSDANVRARIYRASTPGEAKRLGRGTGLVPHWDTRKFVVMYFLLFRKFAVGTQLAAKLLATGDAELIEGNHWHDQIWGDCSCARHRNTPGENWLGRLLMVVREDLR